jgi:hypothetical protein
VCFGFHYVSFGPLFHPSMFVLLSSSVPLVRNTSKMKALNTNIGIQLDGVRP